MNFNLQQLGEQHLDDAIHYYAEHGFLVLSGLEDAITTKFRSVLADVIGVEKYNMADILDPENPAKTFPIEIRQRLVRVTTPHHLAQQLLDILKPLLIRLIGPFVHVSSTFHGQFKGGGAKAVDQGYGADPEYMEVHNPVLLHQDFTGASFPTSPSAVTLWVAMNSYQCWNLRLYPGSHRFGMLCNRFLELDEKGLEALGRPVDVPARIGTAVLFNALILHGTSNPGPLRRVSCDIRFFPLCGFIPSQVYGIDPRPSYALIEGIRRAFSSVLLAPLLEIDTFLGKEVGIIKDVPPSSILNWVNYLVHLVHGEMDKALPHLERFANTNIGFDAQEVYVSRFHGRRIHDATLSSAREMAARELAEGD
jgi:hypothetical protein